MLILSSEFLRGKIGDRSQLEVTTLCQPQSVVTLFEMALGEVEEPLALDINVFVEALYMCCQLEMKATTIKFARLLTTTYTTETVRALPPSRRAALRKALWPMSSKLNWHVCLCVSMLLCENEARPWQ